MIIFSKRSKSKYYYEKYYHLPDTLGHSPKLSQLVEVGIFEMNIHRPHGYDDRRLQHERHRQPKV